MHSMDNFDRRVIQTVDKGIYDITHNMLCLF